MSRASDSPFTLPQHTHSYTFTQIIDADHFTIQRIAAQIRKLLASPPSQPADLPSTLLAQLKPLLLEATWRLIRHDLSEDLVMRPAFASVLGDKGIQLADHDRRDHADGRRALLSVLSHITDIEADLSGPADQDRKRGLWEGMVGKIVGTFDELGEHMRVESGEFLPYFEGIVEAEMSSVLAREYLGTLVVMPGITVASCTSTSDEEVRGKGKEGKVFADEVAYINTDLSELTGVYEKLVKNARRDEKVRESLQVQLEKEIERLQVGKWLGINERVNLGNTTIRLAEPEKGKL